MVKRYNYYNSIHKYYQNNLKSIKKCDFYVLTIFTKNAI